MIKCLRAISQGLSSAIFVLTQVPASKRFHGQHAKDWRHIGQDIIRASKKIDR